MLISTSMVDLDTVLASRVLPRHRVCGYCGKTLSSASLLRRHIKNNLHHERYRAYVTALCMRGAPLSMARSTDKYGHDKETSQQHLLDATECWTETGVEASSCSSLPELCQPQHALDRSFKRYSDGSATNYPGSCERPFPRGGTADEPCHSLQECPEWKMRMWLEAGDMPKVVPKADVYPTGSEHSNEDLFEQFFTLELSKVRTFIDGIGDFPNAKKKRSQLASMAYRYGAKPARDQNTSFRISATAVLDGNKYFHVPRIDGDAVPQYAKSTEVIWATSGGFTPMHIGEPASEMRAISACANHVLSCFRPWKTRCVRVCWLMSEDFPTVASDRTQSATVRPHRTRRLPSIRALS